MSCNKYGYSSEQLKLEEYQALKEKVESLEKINQITHSKLKEDFENTLENELENHEEKIKAEFLDTQEMQNVLPNSKIIKVTKAEIAHSKLKEEKKNLKMN